VNLRRVVVSAWTWVGIAAIVVLVVLFFVVRRKR